MSKVLKLFFYGNISGLTLKIFYICLFLTKSCKFIEKKLRTKICNFDDSNIGKTFHIA